MYIITKLLQNTVNTFLFSVKCNVAQFVRTSPWSDAFRGWRGLSARMILGPTGIDSEILKHRLVRPLGWCWYNLLLHQYICEENLYFEKFPWNFCVPWKALSGALCWISKVWRPCLVTVVFRFFLCYTSISVSIPVYIKMCTFFEE